MRIRRSRSGTRRRETVSLNLASMIDVTFLLLLYFMVTTVLAEPEDRLSPALQTRTVREAGTMADFQPQVVEVMAIGGEPGFRIGTEVLRDRDALVEALGGLHRPSGLFVKVYGDVPVSAAALALQAARDAGFDQVTYVPVD